jgi:hypothetical protein
MPQQLTFLVVGKPEKKKRVPVKLASPEYTAAVHAMVEAAKPEEFLQERRCDSCGDRTSPCLPCWFDQWYSRLKAGRAA